MMHREFFPEGTRVKLHRNNELSDILYSVCLADDIEYWICSCYSREEAEAVIQKAGWSYSPTEYWDSVWEIDKREVSGRWQKCRVESECE